MPKGFVLITLDYPPERGGVARYLGGLVGAAGGEITVVVDAAHNLSGPGEVVARNFFRNWWPKWWPLVSACREFGRSERGIIVSHVLPVGTAAMIAKWFGGVPYAVICHGLDVRLAAANWRRSLVFKLVCRAARLVVVNSEATAEQVKRAAPGVQPLLLTPGVEQLSGDDRAQARLKLGIRADEKVVLAVARLIPRKGIDVLLEASELLPDGDELRIAVVGDGPERSNLEQLAGHVKHRVQFITNATDDEIGLWYRAADVFCLPLRETANDMEGFGIVFLEAAVHGLPVVAGQSGGAAEAIKDGKTGFLVKPNDSHEVSLALRRLLLDAELCTRLGAAGRERTLRDFRWADRWAKLKSELLK